MRSLELKQPFCDLKGKNPRELQETLALSHHQ